MSLSRVSGLYNILGLDPEALMWFLFDCDLLSASGL